jgi:predicted dinucleotide-binding enzyme
MPLCRPPLTQGPHLTFARKGSHRCCGPRRARRPGTERYYTATQGPRQGPRSAREQPQGASERPLSVVSAPLGYDLAMKIGIIGSDQRSVAIGRLLASGGHDVRIGDPLRNEAAQHAAAQINAEVESPYRQAMTCDLIFFADARAVADRALVALGSEPAAVIVDARDGGPAVPHQGAELLARKLDSHHVVRALVVLPKAGANVPICGDDPSAKAVVDQAFQAAGCVTTDRGPLSNAPELEPPRVAHAA